MTVSALSVSTDRTLRVALRWIAAHCVIPDRANKGQPFELYDWQLECAANHYLVRGDAKPGQDGTAFRFRRSQIVAPQKTGKGPFSAAVIMLEALGPCLFGGWAEEGEIYACQLEACGCDFTHVYKAGEPKGRHWSTPLIQLTATSDDQTDNVYEPLKAMLRYGPLSHLVTVGEEFSRLPNDGKIETVTSSALSRLGNPIVFALQDETQLYTDTNKLRRVAETQRRGAAGMGGRSMETTNPWDPAEDSVAQRTWESKRPDIYKFYRNPDTEPALRHGDGTTYKFTVARERRKILTHVYAGSTHVDLDAIEAEALELMEKDPGQAERFYGNRIVAGLGHWMTPEAWAACTKPQDVPANTWVVGGFDGSDTDDWTGFRLETRSGYQFTPCFPDGRPMIWNPAQTGGQVPRLEVRAGMAHIMSTYNVARFYLDPPYWESECDAWAEEYDEKVMLRWYTRRVLPMFAAAERLITDVVKGDSGFTHDACEVTAAHVGNARKSMRGNLQPGDAKTSLKYVLTKPGDGRKIDMAIPSILAHEAHGDMTAAGWPVLEQNIIWSI